MLLRSHGRLTSAQAGLPIATGQWKRIWYLRNLITAIFQYEQFDEIFAFGTFTQLKEMNLYEDAYARALEMIEAGEHSNTILSYLTTAAEIAAGPDTVSSILLLDRDGLLRNGASPRLPADYLKAIDGLRPHAKIGTCAAAAATGNMVVTEDFYADSKWAELRHLPLALGFKGAWSMPITNSIGVVLGTFGTYFTRKRIPSENEIQGIQLLARAAALALASSRHLKANG